jgi:hypothetical protein
MVREWLGLIRLFYQTPHEDRLDTDREIERRAGVYCNDATKHHLISEKEFRESIGTVLNPEKRRGINVFLEA